MVCSNGGSEVGGAAHREGGSAAALQSISMVRWRLPALELFHGVEGKVAVETGAQAWMRGKWGKKRGRSGDRRLFKRLGGAGQRGKNGEGGGGVGVAVGSVGWMTTAPDHRARVAALPREQGRGRVRATRCGWLTRGPERDRGPGVSGGVREREAGQRRGADRRARATQCRGCGSNGILNRFKTFKYFT
jgi:hypothetical protein